MSDRSPMSDYQNFIALSKYARWMENEGRRETWSETVDRYASFMKKTLGDKLPADRAEEIQKAIENLEVMPSMRALMTAGPALERENLAGYNCSFMAVDNLRCFDEAVYILMNGTGLGFSVEKVYVNKLPVIADEFSETNTTIVVEDSKAGWARAYKELISLLAQGLVPKWDMSKVRPKGARLRTFGGRASGPEPLDALFKFTVSMFRKAAGRKLKPIECHDLMCKIGDIVVVGGVRRSALISISDLDDFEMAQAKSGQWWETTGYRRLANNSAIYEYKPSVGQFMEEWKNLYDSKSGERGIVNMESMANHVESFGRRDSDLIAGVNPCGEIILRSMQLCNLTEVVIAPDDTEADLMRKVELATILGTYQATLTNFKYIRKTWQRNCEEERLLGVSFTGIFGNRLMFDNPELGDLLDRLREYAVQVNAEWADKFGINPAAAITCVKPSGTVSQLTNVSSGIHPWYSEHYTRTARADNKDPLTILMKELGFPWEPDVMKPEDTSVFSFPIKAPEGAMTGADLTAIQHLEIWKTYRDHWTEHNPSVTINVREEEWMEVGAWVWNNWDHVGGISFLPYDDHVYEQAPYQRLTEEEYGELVAKMPTDPAWTDLSLYELEDSTKGNQELACVAGACEVVDLVK